MNWPVWHFVYLFIIYTLCIKKELRQHNTAAYMYFLDENRKLHNTLEKEMKQVDDIYCNQAFLSLASTNHIQNSFIFNPSINSFALGSYLVPGKC